MIGIIKLVRNQSAYLHSLYYGNKDINRKIFVLSPKGVEVKMPKYQYFHSTRSGFINALTVTLVLSHCQNGLSLHIRSILSALPQHTGPN